MLNRVRAHLFAWHRPDNNSNKVQSRSVLCDAAGSLHVQNRIGGTLQAGSGATIAALQDYGTPGTANWAINQNQNGVWRGGHFIFNLTALGGGQTVTFSINGADSLGNVYTLLNSPALTAANIGVNVLKIYPGLWPAVNAVASDLLPNTLTVTAVYAAPATAATFSIAVNFFV